jgi:hypothetical protein
MKISSAMMSKLKRPGIISFGRIYGVAKVVALQRRSSLSLPRMVHSGKSNDSDLMRGSDDSDVSLEGITGSFLDNDRIHPGIFHVEANGNPFNHKAHSFAGNCKISLGKP